MSKIYDEKTRHANMEKVLKALEGSGLEFNALIFTFADIIQSTFLNGLLMGKPAGAQQDVQNELIALHNRIIDALNEGDQNMMYDMVALGNLIMDAVERAAEEARADADKS